jgi:O-methyltransferase involved in polyketide biosynthesis
VTRLALPVRAGSTHQVVLLGAGMDGRAFRMDWPQGTRLFEADTAVPTGLPGFGAAPGAVRISAQSAAGRRMGLTLGSRGVIARFGADAVPGSAASMWFSEMPDDPVGRLVGHGWEADRHTLRERAAAYGRPISYPPQREEPPGGLISAVRR